MKRKNTAKLSAPRPPATPRGFMEKEKTAKFTEEDNMLPEYDLRQMRIVKRGPGHELRRQHAELAQLVTVALDPEVAAVFDNEQAVNEALRTLLRVMAAAQ